MLHFYTPLSAERLVFAVLSSRSHRKLFAALVTSVHVTWGAYDCYALVSSFLFFFNSFPFKNFHSTDKYFYSTTLGCASNCIQSWISMDIFFNFKIFSINSKKIQRILDSFETSLEIQYSEVRLYSLQLVVSNAMNKIKSIFLPLFYQLPIALIFLIYTTVQKS